MKVTNIRTRIVNLNFRNSVIVTVETDEGITGMAETAMKRKTHTIEQSILELKRYLVGKDPTEIENHWEKMYRDSFWLGGPMHCSAISAVDVALWEILAKSLGAPVHKVLGGPTRTAVGVYCHCPAGPTPEVFASNVKDCVDRGYRALKTTLPLFYGGSGQSRDDRGGGWAGYSGTRGEVDRHYKETEYLEPSIFRRIREFFLAAREAGGPELGISVDCHGRLSAKNAIQLCKVLEDLDLMWVEEPVPPENADALREVKSSTPVPIAAGERWTTIYGVREFIEKRAVDILQCDIVNCGGITGLKKIAALAEAHYVGMAPHNPNGPLATAVNLQFAAAIPNFYILETIGSEAEWKLTELMLNEKLSFQEGSILVPTRPGYGVGVNEAALDQLPYAPIEGYR